MTKSSSTIVILILLIILLLISDSIIRSCNQPVASKQSEDGSVLISQSIDTVYSKPDTVLQIDTVYIPKLSAELDTSYLADSSMIISASADTTFRKDSSKISVKYFFPPLNYFEIAADIKQKIITQTITLTEVKVIEKPIPFYKDNWFYSSAVLFVLLVFSLLK